MGYLKNGTICSKHDKIMDLTKDVGKILDDIYDLADKCLEDGQNMERGLETKKGRIEELEKEVALLERERDDLKDQLATALEDINKLEEELSRFHATIPV